MNDNRLLRGLVYAFALEAAAVAFTWGAFELATHPWGRWAAIAVALCCLPFLLVASQRDTGRERGRRRA